MGRKSEASGSAATAPAQGSWWARLNKAQAAVITGVLALLSTSIFVAAPRLMPRAESSAVVDKPVAEVLDVESLKEISVNPIDPQAHGAPIQGDLKVALPSGKQIFAAVREKSDIQDVGSVGNGTFSFFRCSADFSAKTFDCGLPWLGKPGDLREYFVFVGLADQNAAGEIIEALQDQAKSNADSNWNHPAPRGFETLPAIVVERR